MRDAETIDTLFGEFWVIKAQIYSLRPLLS
jgi:hypothetical protein